METEREGFKLRVRTPVIARLFGRNRVWARRHALAGDFGPITSGSRRALEVELRGVERFAGHTFTPEQLAAALRVEFSITTQSETVEAA